MNYLILMTILFVTILVLHKFLNFDLFNPIIISILCFEAGLLFCTIMLPYWKYEISFDGILVICILFSFMIFGAFMGKKMSKKIFIKNYNAEIIYINEFTNKKRIILLVIVLLFSFSIIKNYYSIGYKYGYDGNWFEFTRLSMVIKSSNLINGAKLFRINTYMQYVLKGITYCSLFLFIYNIFKLKKSILNNIFLLIYIIPYLFIIYISGWRQDFIFISFYVLVMIGFYNDRSDNKIKELFKSFTIMVSIFLIIFILWCLTAFLRSNGKFNFYEVFKYVATYFGGGIINFDQYINKLVEFPKSKIFGERVFSNIYMYLNRLHITNLSIPYGYLKNDEIINTNIYSAFFRSYNDFGIIGCGIYFGIIFYILSFAYSLLNTYKNLFFTCILYSFFSYPICLVGVDDGFSVFFISTTPLYILLSYGVVYYFMIYNNKKSVI